MVVSGTNSGAFCKDFGTVVLSGLTEPVTISYRFALPDGSVNAFSENYSPDAAGTIRICDLGEVALSFFEGLPFPFTAAHSSPYAIVMDAEILAADASNLGVLSQKFYYSNCRTSIADPYKYRGFLSRHKRLSIHPDQAHFVGFFLNAQQLGIGVLYRSGSSSAWSEFTMDMGDSGDIYYRNFDLQTIVALLLEHKGLSVAADDVFYYIIYLKVNSSVEDAMQVDIDRKHYSAISHFVYYNCFGVPDTFCFTGKDKRTAEMEATYATIQRQYRKISTRYDIYHHVNSGYILSTMRDCVEDLVNSDKVHLYADNTLGEMVTITEVNFDETRPKTEPVNVAIKYRLANECQRTINRDMTVDYRIFDHTFGDTFE